MKRNNEIWIFILSFVVFEALCINGICIVIHKNIKETKQKIEIENKQNEVISNEMIYFPVLMSGKSAVYYEDSFYDERMNGKHEGCDIMYNNNKAGELPVVSSTNGIITNLGWLFLGGYRVGITSPGGIYYYYAHLDSYSESLFVGKEIKAGEFLGFMGDTGNGEEGTRGKFPVHLHFGIYIQNEDNNEICVNPYPFLEKLYIE